MLHGVYIYTTFVYLYIWHKTKIYKKLLQTSREAPTWVQIYLMYFLGGGGGGAAPFNIPSTPNSQNSNGMDQNRVTWLFWAVLAVSTFE